VLLGPYLREPPGQAHLIRSLTSVSCRECNAGLSQVPEQERPLHSVHAAGHSPSGSAPGRRTGAKATAVFVLNSWGERVRGAGFGSVLLLRLQDHAGPTSDPVQFGL
jgi:hypothetical protein